LVVDDDETVLESLKRILESEGYSVDTAEKGRQALARFESEFYDLVLLDIKLPDIEGTKLLEALHARFPDTVKIMVTGYPTLTNAVESLNSGADAYLMKPVNPRGLLKVVKARLGQRGKSQNSGHERMKQPEKSDRSIDRSRSNERPPAAAEKENKPLDKMIETAFSLLRDEEGGNGPPNRSRVRKVATKNNTTPVQNPQSAVQEPQNVAQIPPSLEQKPQSPEQNFWFSLANLDLGGTAVSKTPKKPKDKSKPG